jgi:acetolactate synthase-1/2/3 large subunit
MGFGLPAAIGAKLAAPERPVVALVGDGGFLMSGLELLTARREDAHVTIIVFNDGRLNQIHVQQTANYGHNHAVDLLNPDFNGLCQSLGVDFVRYSGATRDELARALRGDSVALIEVALRDSPAMRRMAIAARTKNVVRSVLGSRVQDWLRRRLRRPERQSAS